MRYNGIVLGSILLGMGLITDKIPLGIRFGSLHTTRLVVALHRAGIQVLVEFWVGLDRFIANDAGPSLG